LDNEAVSGQSTEGANRVGTGCLVLFLWQFVWSIAALAVVLVSLPALTGLLPRFAYGVAVLALVPVAFGVAGYLGMWLVLRRDHTSTAWVAPTVMNVVFVAGTASEGGSGYLAFALVAAISVSAGMWIRIRQLSGHTLSRIQIALLATPTTILLCLAVILSAGGVREFRVMNDALLPTVPPGDIVLSYKSFGTAAALETGDIVVSNDPSSSDRTIIRTVGAVAGQTVPSADSSETITVPTGQVWLSSSPGSSTNDSSVFGPQPLTIVSGRVFAVVWPLNHIRLLVWR
jgi:inner membrane protease subunit 2